MHLQVIESGGDVELQVTPNLVDSNSKPGSWDQVKVYVERTKEETV